MSPKLPPPGSPDAPKYWKYEVSGRLADAVRLYLEHPESLGPTGIGLLRDYFAQWIGSPVWDMKPLEPYMDPEWRGELYLLRVAAAEIRTVADVNAWLRRADKLEIDPL